MDECLFCKIVAKETPADLIYGDDKVVAFLDINPQAPHHIIIIPKVHIPTLLDLEEEDEELMGHILLVAKKIAKERGLEERGFRLVLNCKSDAGQVVYHLHLHLIGGRKMSWPPG